MASVDHSQTASHNASVDTPKQLRSRSFLVLALPVVLVGLAALAATGFAVTAWLRHSAIEEATTQAHAIRKIDGEIADPYRFFTIHSGPTAAR